MIRARDFSLSTLMLYAAFAWAQPREAAPLPPVLVTVEQMDNNGHVFFAISASAFARAAPLQAWQVLTDYDRLPEFVPDITSSKLVSRNGDEAVIEQQSQAAFLFFTQTIRMVVRVKEQPYSAIDVALVSGDMKHYSARWELAPGAHNGIDGTHITYSGTMEPDFFVPPLLADTIAKISVKKMVEAVVLEIDKRVQ